MISSSGRLVVGAVVAGPDDDVAVVVQDLANVHGHVVADELLVHERSDGVRAPDLAVVVVDVGVGREGVGDAVGVGLRIGRPAMGGSRPWWQFDSPMGGDHRLG
jgi:hypothetical protein